MKRKLEVGYEKYKEHGITRVCRSGSRVLTRKAYDLKNGKEYNKSGIKVTDEQWDNLIILDACRYDIFKKYNTIEGKLEHRISRGSTSAEFIEGNFSDLQAYDTVYLSDNPWYGRIHREIESELYHFSFCERDAFDGTVSHPSSVTDSAIEYYDQHPNKRFIVHYMQPHAPYFTADGEERFRWPGDSRYDCTPEELRDAYVDNLKLVLSELPVLLEKLEGKTVITADHGELLGERLPPIPLRQYSHPGGIYKEALVKVPWLIIDGDEQKEIIEESSPEKFDYGDHFSDKINTQLEDLGYL